MPDEQKEWRPRLLKRECTDAPEHACSTVAKLSFPFRYPALFVLSPDDPSKYRAGLFVTASRVDMMKPYTSRPPVMKFYAVSGPESFITCEVSCRPTTNRRHGCREDASGVVPGFPRCGLPAAEAGLPIETVGRRVAFLRAFLSVEGAYARNVRAVMAAASPVFLRAWDVVRPAMLEALDERCRRRGKTRSRK